MPTKIRQLLHVYRQQLEAVSNGHIKKIILYGSYARGDNRPDSDIDIMILVDVKDSILSSYESKFFDVTYDFNLEHNTDIMPIVQNMNHFDYWKNAYMFYHNVDTEGVAI